MVLKALVARADADENKHTRGDESAPALARRARPRGFVAPRRRCATTSVRTIDLAHLLRSFDGRDVAAFTVTIGANPAFSKRIRPATLDQGRRGAGVEALRRRGGRGHPGREAERLSAKRQALGGERGVDPHRAGGQTSARVRARQRRIRWRDEYVDASPRAFDAVRVEENETLEALERDAFGELLDRRRGLDRSVAPTRTSAKPPRMLRRSFLPSRAKARNIRCDRLWTGTRATTWWSCGYDESSRLVVDAFGELEAAGRERRESKKSVAASA